MLFYHASIFLLVLLSLLLQQFVPTFGSLYDSRILILPLVFLCCSVTTSSAAMLILAFVSGFLWDAQHVLPPDIGNAEVYKEQVEALPFGYSILLYAVMGFMMQGVQPLFQRGKWHFSVLVSGMAIFIYLSAEYLLINFVRGDFFINRPTLLKISFTALLTMIVAPFVYGLLFYLARTFHYTIRYDGLRSRNRFNID